MATAKLSSPVLSYSLESADSSNNASGLYEDVAELIWCLDCSFKDPLITIMRRQSEYLVYKDEGTTKHPTLESNIDTVCRY